MKPALIAAMVLALAISFAPRCESQQGSSNVTHPSEQKNPPSVSPSAGANGAAANNYSYQNQSPDGDRAPQWVLVIVGIITGGFICWQALETRRAAQATRDSVGHMERQAGIMDGQLRAMGEQLSAMKESIAITKDSVEFAKKNLEVFINEKRARIFVELEPLNLDKVYTFESKYTVRYTVSCHGQTFAFVDDSRAEAKVTDSSEPPDLARFSLGSIDLPKAIPPETKPTDGVFIIWDNIDAFILASISHGKSFVHCRGIVKYKDFVGEERETAFCYRWKPRVAPPGIGGGYWEKTGPPEANRAT